jgi:hypothetical protein
MLITANPTDRPQYRFDYPHSPQLLDQLYAIDCEAYGAHSVDRSILESWVKICPESITLILDGESIAGAFGLLAVSEEQIRMFIAGELKESEFRCLPGTIENHRFWYWSGIVLPKKYRLTRHSPLRSLLSWGIDCWLTSGRLAHNAYVYASPCSQDGQNLLDRFQFEQIKSGAEMADGIPLSVREIKNPEQMRGDLRGLLSA